MGVLREGLSKILRAPIHRARRAVLPAIARHLVDKKCAALHTPNCIVVCILLHKCAYTGIRGGPEKASMFIAAITSSSATQGIF